MPDEDLITDEGVDEETPSDTHSGPTGTPPPEPPASPTGPVGDRTGPGQELAEGEG